MVLLVLRGNSNNGIFGKWKTVEDVNGYHLVMEFVNNGSFSHRMTMEGAGTYQVKGSVVHFDSVAIGPEISDLQIEGDSLFIEMPERVEVLTRIDKQVLHTPPIVGRWVKKGVFENGQKYSMAIEFTKTKRFKSVYEFELKEGSYEITGDLIMSLDEKPWTQRFRIDSDFLVFEPDSRRPGKERFRRIR